LVWDLKEPPARVYDDAKAKPAVADEGAVEAVEAA